MDENARLQLQKMIKANNVQDQTELIRDLKHSHKLQLDINRLLFIKMKYRNSEDAEQLIQSEGSKECSFLFMYYTDIYNKIRKDEIDLSILNKFLNILQEIENGTIDQHEGAFMVGTLLKELYIDSALKKAEKLNSDEIPVVTLPVHNISWKEYLKEKDSSHPSAEK